MLASVRLDGLKGHGASPWHRNHATTTSYSSISTSSSSSSSNLGGGGCRTALDEACARGFVRCVKALVECSLPPHRQPHAHLCKQLRTDQRRQQQHGVGLETANLFDWWSQDGVEEEGGGGGGGEEVRLPSPSQLQPHAAATAPTTATTARGTLIKLSGGLPASSINPHTGATPLHLAAANGHALVVALLLQYWSESAAATASANTATTAGAATRTAFPGDCDEDEEPRRHKVGAAAAVAAAVQTSPAPKPSPWLLLPRQQRWLSGVEHGTPWCRDAKGQTPAQAAAAAGHHSLAATIDRAITQRLRQPTGFERKENDGDGASGGGCGSSGSGGGEALNHATDSIGSFPGDHGTPGDWAEDLEYAYEWPSD